MKHTILRLIVILIIIGGVAGGYWYLNQHPEQVVQLKLRFGLITEAEATGVHSASGFIEAEEINIAAETKGRIARLLINEGDFVTAGQPLVELDVALLEAGIKQAEARIGVAEAQLAKVEAGVRPEEIGKAEAAVAVAEANAEAARTRWQDAITLRDNPQELDRQIDAAKTSLQLAELRIKYAIPVKDANEAVWDLQRQQWEAIQNGTYVHYYNPMKDEGIRDIVHPPEGEKRLASEEWNRATADQWAAWVDLNTAVTERDDTQTALNDLLRMRNDPQEANVQVTQAEAAYQAALAEVEVAKAQLEILKAGARAEQIAVAQAQVEQAEAGLTALNVDRDKHTLVAPADGWVVEKVAHEGEMAAPGAPLLTLADLSKVTLTIYVAEPDIGTVSVGQKVDVFIDTFPNRPFTGHITYISNEAEFTPKNVQTKEERVNTVFAVKIALDNEDHDLKPGMPADAILSRGPEL